MRASSAADGWWLDLDGEPPPAVVAHLAVRGTPADAAAATLLDLAARGYVDLRQPAGDPRQTTVHLSAHRAAGVDAVAGLFPHERRVLDRVRDVAVEGVAPLVALTFRDGDQAVRWAGGFAAEVAADARALGLTRRFLLLGERRTPAGREVVARWRGLKRVLRSDEAFAALPPAAVAVWGRHLAFGQALGLTRTCSAVLDLGAADGRRDHRRLRPGARVPRRAVLAAVWAGLGCAVLRCASAVRGPWPEAGHLSDRVSAGLEILGAVLLAIGATFAAITAKGAGDGVVHRRSFRP